MSAYLLDPALAVVPDGVVGEICLGGPQLARGYLRRPALTAQRFIADPYAPGQRLYRTGDLARRRADGALEFVGRADEQVKVRGFRIELGEIAAAAATHPDVAHALVIADESAAGTACWPAIAAPGAGLDVDAVRDHIGAVLPAYMVPDAVIAIDEVPQTVHGKLDRDALPRPGADRAKGAGRAPQTPTEHRVAAIFGELFSRDGVAADDSFFDLGGHSLLAARLVTALTAEFASAST